MTRPRGFTMVELLVAMAIFTLALGFVFIDFRRVNEREYLRQTTVDFSNLLLQLQGRSLAASVNPACPAQYQYYVVFFFPSLPLNVFCGTSTFTQIDAFPLRNTIVVHRVRVGTDSGPGVSDPYLAGFELPRAGAIVSPAAAFNPVPNSIFVYFRHSDLNQCRRVALESSGRITQGDAPCP